MMKKAKFSINTTDSNYVPFFDCGPLGNNFNFPKH